MNMLTLISHVLIVVVELSKDNFSVSLGSFFVLSDFS